MNEAKFNSELVSSLKAAGAWAYKIPDAPVSQTYGMQFTPKKPCDIVGCFGRTFFAIEGKQIKEFKAFGPNALRPSQKENLNQIVNTGGRAFVFLNIRIPVRNDYENRLLVFDWYRFKDSSSIKKPDIMKYPYIAGKLGTFDLWPFLLTL